MFGYTSSRTGLTFRLLGRAVCHDTLQEYRSTTNLHAHENHSDMHPCTHTHRSTGVPTLPLTVFPSSIVTVCVTDLISPTICWLEAQHRRSYPAWQIQTASVYACFSQGLTQYGRVESHSWPPNLHPHILASKDSGIVRRTDSFSCLVRAIATILQSPFTIWTHREVRTCFQPWKLAIKWINHWRCQVFFLI